MQKSDKKNSKSVVGLMSGTSVDGIDACLVKINSDLSYELISSLVYEYPDNIKQRIFGLFEKNISIEELCKMNFVLGEYFALAALEVINKSGYMPENIDLIGSHGQTVFHYPFETFVNGLSEKSTLQIGEPSVIAERTGITTIADFRPRDIAAGGHGAPLVCFADEIFFKSENIVRAIQNIGGIANVTVVGNQAETMAFDTGPGNVLIDYATRKYFNQEFDKDAEIALKGNIDESWLENLMQEEYFKLTPPKTTGRELFSSEYVEKILQNAPESNYDKVATLTAFTAKSIYQAYNDFIFPKTKVDEIVIGGGGAYNPRILELLGEYFNWSVKIFTHEDFGISNKFKEAIAFALLAYTTSQGVSNNVPSCTGAKFKRVLGKIVLGNIL